MKALLTKSLKLPNATIAQSFIFACVILLGVSHTFAQPWTEVSKLIASDAAAGDWFGRGVVLSGDTAIVGAPFNGAGAAYILERNSGGTNNWGEVKKLTASDAAAGDQFGTVWISGDTAIVAAPAAAIFAGAAYVFERNSGGANNWGEVRKLTASDAATSDLLGAGGLVISGDTVIIGAHGDNNFAGAAYIFERNSGGTNNWGEVKKLTASDAALGDRFGAGSTINGDTAIVGARFNDAAGIDSGAAYVFERNSGGANNWGEVKKLTVADAAAGDLFGSPTISGDTAIIGALFNDAAGIDAGAAYVFERNSGGTNNWGKVKKLTASDAMAGDGFGAALLSGDRAIVGVRSNDAAGIDAGAAYILERNSGGADNWGEVQKLTASDAAAGDSFGDSFTLSGNTVIVGARLNDDAGIDSGSAYVFTIDNNAPRWEVALLHQTFSGTAVLNKYGQQVSRAGDVNNDGFADYIVAAPENFQNSQAGTVKVFSGADGSELHSINGDSNGDELGWSIDAAGDVNNDNYDDIIVGIRHADNNGIDSGTIRVYSGLDGEVLYSMDGTVLFSFDGDAGGDSFGQSVAGVGDLNGDGYDDFAGGAPWANSGTGYVKVYSGKDGNVLINGGVTFIFTGDAANSIFGASMAGAGDVNGDGVPDLIVGAYLSNLGGTFSGMARVFSGADGTELYTFIGDDPEEEFGLTVDAAGDVNGDGYADVIVGSNRTSALPGDSVARVFSGSDGSFLYDLSGPSLEKFGGRVSGAGDVNQDGFDDFLVASHNAIVNGLVVGKVELYSGQDGSILQTLYGENDEDDFGDSIDGGFDVNNDGLPDFIVGMRSFTANGFFASGQARVYITKAFQSLGTTDASTGSTPIQVSSLYQATISDPDIGAAEGIALIGTTGPGTWKFSTDGGTYSPVEPVSRGQALLLRDIDLVRYTPSQGLISEEAKLEFLAWDQSTGSEGIKVDTNFTTAFSSNAIGAAFQADVDADGIPDTLEDGAPNDGDGNNDAIADSEQSNVASVPNQVDQQYVTLESPPNTILVDVTAAPPPAPGEPGLPIINPPEFPVGVLDFKLQDFDIGAEVIVTLFVPPGVNAYWKFGPDLVESTPHWYKFRDYNGVGTTGAEFLSNPDRVILHLIDGQLGDDNLAGPDGVIVDPGAPVIQPELCRVFCPEDIVVNNDSGSCGANVNFAATLHAECSNASITYSPPPGNFFPKGTTIVNVTATDDSGVILDECSFTVTVLDGEQPTIVCLADITVNNDSGSCGAVVNYTAPVGTDNCPGASTAQIAGLGSGATFLVGTTVETYTVTDAAGNTSSCSFTVTVNDAEIPSITCPTDIVVDNNPGQCGAVVTYTAPVGTDNCAGATTELAAGLGSGIFFPVGTTTETYRVTDAAGNTAECSFSVTVTEPPPAVTFITAPIDPLEIGSLVTASGTFSDDCDCEDHTATWDWGDGTTGPETIGVIDQAANTVTGSHLYSVSGVYRLKLTVTNCSNNSATDDFKFIVIYDPDGGFVTGGGTFDSLPGAYVPDSLIGGTANFGFVSKYKKNSDVPIGNTEFQLQVASLNFHSDEYQWLVVAGHKAMYKGDGTINNAGNYGFLVSAIDEKLTPSIDVDLFRIKIWDKGDGDTVVYDNQLGDLDEDADPVPEITTGSIVIHKPTGGGPQASSESGNFRNLQPVFDRINRTPEGLFEIEFSAGPQMVYAIQTSQDLMHWHHLDFVLSNIEGNSSFTDESATSVRQFYRLILAASVNSFEKPIVSSQ